MYSHTVPTQVDDYINTISYPVEAPEYAMRKSDAIKAGELDPLFIPDKNAKVLTRLTIADMIDFCSRTIPFKILYSKDIIEIGKYLPNYIEQLSQYSSIEEAAQYIAKARHFNGYVQKSLKIVAKTDPVAKKMVETDNFIKLFSSAVTKET